MKKENLYIPVLRKGIFVPVMMISAIISFFITIFVDLFFYLLGVILNVEYFSIFNPFVTVFLVIFWMVCLIIPGRSKINKLLSIYYKNENGELIRYRLNIENVLEFGELASATAAGTVVGGLANNRTQGRVASQQIAKVVKGILLNTDKNFVLEHLQNETFYKKKKIDETKLDSMYESIDYVNNTKPIRFFRRIFKHVALLMLIVVVINSINFAVATANTKEIQDIRNDIQQDIFSELKPFGYVDKSEKQFLHFQRETIEQTSNIKLHYNYKGELIERDSEVQVYWNYNEDTEHIVNELRTIFTLLDLDFNDGKYREAVEEMKTGQGSVI